MTVKIPKSIATPEFIARVEAFRQAKIDHQKTIDVPAPAEHHLIEACVKRVSRADAPDDHVIDYEIVDDAPSFEERKSRLIGQVAEAEHAALHAVLPAGKRRLHSLRVAEIHAIDEEERSPEQIQFLADDSDRAKRIAKISRHGAELHAEIEDLTEATIDAWRLRKFPA